MSNPELSSAEKKLQKLGQKVRQGWAKLHPLKDQEMNAVREAMQRQFEQQQGQTHEQAIPAKSTEVEKAKTQERSKNVEKRKSQSKDYGHEH